MPASGQSAARLKEVELARSSQRYPGVEWVEVADAFIRINESLCTGCGNCLKVCLGGCFTVESKKARIKNLDECMECASCWYVCPDSAIDFTWPPGGAGYRSDWG
jgi:NAD-dependent dihydropyrimidine dehydrogenase PreA subunit